MAAPESQHTPLVVRLCNWVGEVVLCVPSLVRLEKAGYALELVGKSWAPALLAGHPWRVTVRRPLLGGAVSQLHQLRRDLAARSPAFARERPALLFTKSFSSALEARLAGLHPAGYAHDGRRWLLAKSYPKPPATHMLESYWHLTSRFLGTEAPRPETLGLNTAPAAAVRAREILEVQGITPGSFVLLCPFSGADDAAQLKVWPGFPSLARELRQHRIRSLICPGPGEEARAAAMFPDALFLPGLDLGIYGALMRQARRVVANDTGPGHLAAAVGAPLVSVYGPKSVADWAPVGRTVQLLHPSVGWAQLAEVLAAVLA